MSYQIPCITIFFAFQATLYHKQHLALIRIDKDKLLMSNQQVSKEEIKQLLSFMNRIKAFEKTFIIQKNSIIKLIWGLLLMGAGVLGFVISKIIYASESTESFGVYTIVPWVIAIFSGLIIQIFSERHLINIYSWEKQESKIDRGMLYLILGFIIMIFLVSYFNSTPDLYFLTFPSITIVSGLMSLLDKKYYQENQEILNQKSLFLTPIVCIIVTVIMIVLFMIDKSNIHFQGVLFGFGFGGSFSFNAFMDRKGVEKYLEKIDISTKS